MSTCSYDNFQLEKNISNLRMRWFGSRQAVNYGIGLVMRAHHSLLVGFPWRTRVPLYAVATLFMCFLFYNFFKREAPTSLCLDTTTIDTHLATFTIT